MRLVGLIHARRDPIGIYSGKAGKYSGAWGAGRAGADRARYQIRARPNVGAGLLAKAVVSPTLMLTDTTRYREQARSHRGSGVAQSLYWLSNRSIRALRRRLISVSMCGAKSSITSCMINCAAARSSLSRCSRASGLLLAAGAGSAAGAGGVGSTAGAGCADRVEQHRNLFLITVFDRIGQQRRLQVVIAEQLADRLEVVQQVRGLVAAVLECPSECSESL